MLRRTTIFVLKQPFLPLMRHPPLGPNDRGSAWPRWPSLSTTPWAKRPRSTSARPRSSGPSPPGRADADLRGADPHVLRCSRAWLPNFARLTCPQVPAHTASAPSPRSLDIPCSLRVLCYRERARSHRSATTRSSADRFRRGGPGSVAGAPPSFCVIFRPEGSAVSAAAKGYRLRFLRGPLGPHPGGGY